MESNLNLEEFERLTGAEFTGYVVRMKDFQINSDFLQYFAKKKDQWDDVHLELAIWWLGKSKLSAAYHEIANFIGHRSRSIRFLAISLMVEMKCEIDAQIMSRVIEELEGNSDPADRQALNEVLRKPATEGARLIVQQYLEAIS